MEVAWKDAPEGPARLELSIHEDCFVYFKTSDGRECEAGWFELEGREREALQEAKKGLEAAMHNAARRIEEVLARRLEAA